jgi:hypothetical protein
MTVSKIHVGGAALEFTNLSHARLTGVDEEEGEEDMVEEGCSTLARLGAAVVRERKSDRDEVQQVGHLA